MSLPTLGYLAQNFVQRTHITRLNSELSTLGKELSTGLVADVSKAMRGDTQSLAAINRGLTALDSHDFAANEAAYILDATEKRIDVVRGRLGDVFELSGAVLGSGNAGELDVIAALGRENFEAMLADLNSQTAGMSLFSGTATAEPALRGAKDIFADVVAAVAGATTAQEVGDAIDAYFGPGGAFETNDYLGTTTSRSAMRVGPEDSVDFAPRADHGAFRDGLKALARFAVLEAGVLAGDTTEKLKLGMEGLERLTNADRGLIGLQAKAGAAQARVETAQTRNAAERHGLETARLGFTAADPFKTATRLQETQTQLESLYAVTARLSRLNLTSYL